MLFQRLMQSFNRSMKNKQLMQDQFDLVLDFGVNIGLYRNRHQRPLLYHDKLTSQEFWDLEELGGIKDQLTALKSHWEKLKNEALDLIEIHDWTQNPALWNFGVDDLDSDGKWRTLVFAGSGENPLPGSICNTVPSFCKYSRIFPGGLSCRDGRMKLAVLEGRSHVKPHCGLTNTKLRVNLPLIVPSKTSSSIRVGEITKTLEEGKILVFDDSFEHEVWNESDGVRVVLLFDINHPELDEEGIKEYENRLRDIIEDFDGPNYDE